MLKLHLVSLLLIYYTTNFATNAVTNRTDGATHFKVICRLQSFSVEMFRYIIARFLLTSVSCSPSAIAELLVFVCYPDYAKLHEMVFTNSEKGDIISDRSNIRLNFGMVF